MKTIDLELAQELRRLGFRKGSECYWINIPSQTKVTWKLLKIQDHNMNYWNGGIEVSPMSPERIDFFIIGQNAFPAYTLDEVLDELPDCIIGKKKKGKYKNVEYKWYLEMSKEDGVYCFEYNHSGGGLTIQSKCHTNSAQAAGLMLKWLIVEGHYKVN